MARVNVEPWAFGEGRLVRLAGELGWDIRQALGLLVFLWHDSQELKVARATADEIAEWARAKNAEESQAVIAGLLRARYITDLGNGRYEIRGNKTQLDQLAKFVARGKKGGAATRKKWASEKAKMKQEDRVRLEAWHKPASSVAQAWPNQTNPSQAKPSQPNPDQGKDFFAPEGAASAPVGATLELVPTDGPDSLPAKPKKRSKGGATTPLWDAYAAAYLARWKVEPRRNATQNGLLSNFLARIGAEDAPDVLRHYVQSNHRFYVDAKHSLKLAVRDAEKLEVEWRTGQHGTEVQAREADRNAANDDAFQDLHEFARAVDEARGLAAAPGDDDVEVLF